MCKPKTILLVRIGDCSLAHVFLTMVLVVLILLVILGAAFVMYGSYLLLFLQFFVGRYYGTPTGITSTKKQKKA